MDEIELLTTARPVAPPTPEATVAARRALQAMIDAEPQAGPAPRRVRWLPRRVLIPAMAAGVTLVLGLGLGPGSGLGPRLPFDGPARPDLTGVLRDDAGPLPPQQLRNYLLTAANQVLRDNPSSRRYWVSTVESGQLIQVGATGNRYAIMGRYDETTWHSTRRGDPTRHYQQWIGGAPASDRDRAAWRRAGAPSSWPLDPPPGCPPRPTDDPRAYPAAAGPVRVVTTAPGVGTFDIAGVRLTAAQVGTLPTDPARLKDWAVTSIRRAHPIRTTSELNKALFDAMLNLLYQSPGTPAVRAAAYRLLADLPGLRDRGAVTDPLGRAGVAFTFTTNEQQPGVRAADSGGPQEVRLIFDPASGQPLTWETRQLRPVDYLSWVPAGALFNYQALVRTRWTDEAPPEVADNRPETAVEESTC